MNKNLRILLGVIGIFLLIYILWNVRTIIYYFFTATIIAFVGRPLMSLLGRIRIKGRHLPNWSRALVVMISLILILFGFFQLIIPTVISQANIIASMDPEILTEQLEPQIALLADELEKFGTSPDEIETAMADEVTRIFGVAKISDIMRTFIGGLTDSFIAVFSILFITFFLMKDGTIVDNMVKSLTPDKYLESINSIFNKTKNLLSRYFIGVLLQIGIIMTIISVGLTLIGVDNAIIIGLLAGVFNIIPYLGPLLGGAIGISLAVTTELHIQPDLMVTAFALKALSVFVTAQMVDNFVLQPLIFSKSVKAHPLEIFIVILAAGTLGGVVGMILAVPLYSFLRIVAKEFFNGYKVVQGLTKNL